MNPVFKKFKHNVRLDPKRKTEIRAYLLQVANASPLAEPGASRVTFGRARIFSFVRPMPVLVGVAVVVLVGGGVSFAAENSLPGDPLYAVKTQVNEKVLAALAVSPRAKASLEANLAVRRIDEASKLADSGKLDSKTEASLEDDFKNHSAAMNNQITALQAEGDVDDAADISSHFEASLRGQTQVLGEIENDEDHAADVNPLREEVSSTAGTVAGLRSMLEMKIISEIDKRKGIVAQGRVQAAEHAVNALKSSLDSHKNILNTDDAAALQNQLNSANDLLEQAKLKLQSNADADAFSLAGEGLRAAEEAGVVVNSGRRHHGKGDGNFSSAASSSVSASGTATSAIQNGDENHGGDSLNFDDPRDGKDRSNKESGDGSGVLNINTSATVNISGGANSD